MKIRILLSVLSVLLALLGCARFTSHQVKVDPDGSRTESRQIISTFWDSKSSIAKLRASTTDKTQGLTVGSVDQESSSSNAVDLVERVVAAAVKAAVKP